jgi:hypothetical protein
MSDLKSAIIKTSPRRQDEDEQNMQRFDALRRPKTATACTKSDRILYRNEQSISHDKRRRRLIKIPESFFLCTHRNQVGIAARCHQIHRYHWFQRKAQKTVQFQFAPSINLTGHLLTRF